MVFNMILKIFSVFDSKAAFFGNPFVDQREASAIRAFRDAVNKPDENNGFFRHPEDYSLFLLGVFDNETGEIECGKPLNLITASAIKELNNLPANQFVGDLPFLDNIKEKTPA